MNNIIELSAEEIIEYMLCNKASIRATANHFNCSKTLIWSRINEYNGEKKDLIKKQLNNNLKGSYKNLKNFKG